MQEWVHQEDADSVGPKRGEIDQEKGWRRTCLWTRVLNIFDDYYKCRERPRPGESSNYLKSYSCFELSETWVKIILKLHFFMSFWILIPALN